MSKTSLVGIDDESYEYHSEAQILELQKPGDIILVRNDSAFVSRLYQSACYLPAYHKNHLIWKEIPSHALIVVCPGLYLHSVPKQGVHLVKAEAFRLGQFPFVKVLRRTHGASIGQEEISSLVEACVWHYGQSYNFKINLTWWKRKFRSHSYCSQLIASIYERTGKPLGRKSSNITLPVDLLSLAPLSGWHDVTPDYLATDAMLENRQGDWIIFEVRRDLIKLEMEQSLEMAHSQKVMHQVHLITKMLDRRRKIQRALAVVSQRVADKYKRLAFSSSDQKSFILEPDQFFKAVIRYATDLTNGQDIFSETNSWLMSDVKFQSVYQKQKIESAIETCKFALAYCLASYNFANEIIGGTHVSFTERRSRLMEAIFISDEQITLSRQIVSTKLEKIDSLVVAKDRLAILWASSAIGFLKLGLLAQILRKNDNLEQIRQSQAFKVAFDPDWIKLASGLSKEDIKSVERHQNIFMAMLIRRSDPVDNSDRS